MKIKILKMYDMPISFGVWVIGFTYRNESVRAIYIDEDGRLDDIDIKSIILETK